MDNLSTTTMNSSSSDPISPCQENNELYFILGCHLQAAAGLVENDTKQAPLWLDTVLTDIIIPWSCLIGVGVIVATLAIVRSRCVGKTTNNYYLIALGIIDLTSLITIFVCSPPILGLLVTEIGKEVLAPFLSTFLQMTIFLSNWVTVTLALDRHHAICKPFKFYTRSYTLRNKNLALVIIFVSCIALYLPQFFLISGFTTAVDDRNMTVTLVQYSILGMNRLYEEFYLWFITFILLLLLPTIVILLVNTHLVLCVTSSTRLLYHSTNLSISKSVKDSFTRENIKISALLFCLITTFFCFQIPFVILLFLQHYHAGIFANNATHLFNKIVTFLYVLKHDINFMFYLWFSKRFMRTVQALVCFKCNHVKRRNSFMKSRISSSKRRSAPY